MLIKADDEAMAVLVAIILTLQRLNRLTDYSIAILVLLACPFYSKFAFNDKKLNQLYSNVLKRTRL